MPKSEIQGFYLILSQLLILLVLMGYSMYFWVTKPNHFHYEKKLSIAFSDVLCCQLLDDAGTRTDRCLSGFYLRA